MKGRYIAVMIASLALILAAAFFCMAFGSVDIPLKDVFASLTGGEVSRTTWRYIVVETRLPAVLTSLLAGAALGVAGLLLQTTFDNPLAGPSILGISTGASLGVAVVILALGGAAVISGMTAILVAALAGALFVITILLLMSSLVRSATMLLIAGILIGYLSSSAISLLNFFGASENVHAYVIWGMGTFNSVTLSETPLFAILVALFILISFFYAKPLNAMLLGERYAESVGVGIRRTRNGALFISGALTAIVTSWCGPIGFIGLAVPHVARLALQTSDHRLLIPATVLIGAAVSVVCQFLSVLPGHTGIIPINAITPIMGVPVIIYIIVKRRSIFYFN